MSTALLETGLLGHNEKARVDGLHEAVLHWFQDNGRSFPWRTTQDPYHILVAEVCLQRTNADKVVAVFASIVSHYPTIAALAEADPDEIREHFSRLGLFKRASFLVEIAQAILDQHGGVIPRAREALLKVRGIGDYTASSVTCLAYGERLPLLDGSTQRVLGRVFNMRVDKPAWADRRMRDFMQAILPTTHVREFNLALIDIAYKYCRPRKPRCSMCPLGPLCLTPPDTGRPPNGS